MSSVYLQSIFLALGFLCLEGNAAVAHGSSSRVVPIHWHSTSRIHSTTTNNIPVSMTASSSFTSVQTTTTSATPSLTPLCDRVHERKEWRALSDSEKEEYMEAVKCLQGRPQRSGFDGVVSRFDDFQGLHVNLTEQVHLVGQFLPWHRRFIGLYETALREECGYTGAQPYWNWSLDIDNNRDLQDSPIFSSETGFGGNGVDGTYPDLFGTDSSPPSLRISGWGGGCVLDGPFAFYTVALGPGRVVNPHCLVRSINHTMYQFLTSEAVSNATIQPTFELFRIELEGKNVTATHKAHDGGHLAVGGDLGNVFSSPGDPLFFLHHANLDRIWWNWQVADLQNRLYQVSGRTTVQPPWVNVTLDFSLITEPVATNIPIRDVMDVGSNPLCYTYV